MPVSEHRRNCISGRVVKSVADLMTDVYSSSQSPHFQVAECQLVAYIQTSYRQTLQTTVNISQSYKQERAFSALTLLIGWQEEHQACNN